MLDTTNVTMNVFAIKVHEVMGRFPPGGNAGTQLTSQIAVLAY
jgi:hypothetical protein